jgi:nitrogen-specific signal transduction histidine kinase
MQSKINSQDEISPEIQALIDTIKKQLSTISRFRDEVLKLKRPHESRIETTHLPTLITEVTQSIIGFDSDLSLEFGFTPHLQKVDIDVAALKLCLQVLIQNAVDELSEKKNKKRILIVLRDATDDENRQTESPLAGLGVDVIDNGSGISPDLAIHLFKKMESHKPKGLGMGLLHCRAIALSAQGNVYYDDTYKGGTKFTLLIPYIKKGVQ